MHKKTNLLLIIFLLFVITGCNANKETATNNLDSPVVIDMFKGLENKVHVQIVDNTEVATRFSATTGFDALEVYCPSYGNDIGDLTFLLYKWDIDYYTTMEGIPITQKTFENFENNTWLILEFDTQDPGEYMWVLTKGVEVVGVWKSGENMENLISLFNGQTVDGNYMARIHYVNTPELIFGNPSDVRYVQIPPPHVYLDNHPIKDLDVYPDTWAVTDGLGRTVPGFKEVGGVRKDKFVGLFYWTWHYAWAKSVEPRNITQIMANHPKAKYDLDHPEWGQIDAPHFWNEPLFGYYDSTDPWVLRRHAEMLADAGVDVIIFDCTNGSFTWRPSYIKLFEVFIEARNQGVKTPQIAFMLPFGASEDSLTSLKQLYQDIYRDGKYHELWFYWNDKPLIMAYPNNLGDRVEDANDRRLRNEIKDFFTFRPGQPSYVDGDVRGDQWGWLSVFPQQLFGKTKDNLIEQITVSVAQNHSATKGLTAMNDQNVFGRSYTVQYGIDSRPDSKLCGANFEEQWEYALEVDPEFIFITGWNEWIAGRHNIWQGVKNAFPDQFDDEHSRDIEPTKGELKDHYYYQMVSYIRKFKGVRAPLEASGNKSIDIYSEEDEWIGVKPEFRHYAGSTRHRDYNGWKGIHYTNTTGRNDIILSKVAYDKDNIYYMVETASKLTPKTDSAWMRLFLDTTASDSRNWEGYEYVVNRVNPGEKAVLEVSTGGWNWEMIGNVEYAIKGNRLELMIPRSMLGIDNKPIDIRFKWSDNMQNDGDIMDFYQYGDTAPGGRFNYHYFSSGN